VRLQENRCWRHSEVAPFGWTGSANQQVGRSSIITLDVYSHLFEGDHRHQRGFIRLLHSENAIHSSRVNRSLVWRGDGAAERAGLENPEVQTAEPREKIRNTA
jgi:hypothetical protein